MTQPENLPDEVLVHTLSFLAPHNLEQTCLVSHRWTNLSVTAAQVIREKYPSDSALIRIFNELTKKNYNRLALDVAQLITFGNEKDWALESNAQVLLKNGWVGSAVFMVMRKSKNNLRTGTLQRLSYRLAEEGEIDKSIKSIESVR